jgi:Cd2+/Zn2+-exporting ATPase/Cu+-exporting ATPase
MKRIELPVGGMDCASCAAHVRTALGAVDGVASAEVLLGAARAVVDYDESRVAPRQLAAAVTAAGYSVPEAALPESAGAPHLPVADGLPARALRVTGLLFGAVLLLVVVGEGLGASRALSRAIPLPIGALLVLLVGWPAFVGVARATLRGRVISHTLMTVGVVAALVIGQWTTAAVVAFFMRVGDFVEGFTMRRGRRALRDLAALAPARARVERGGEEVEVAADEVRVGEVVVVRPGERIPADGEVVSGSASVEQAAITGEPLPVDVGPGARVYAATIPRAGSLRVRVARVGRDATFGRIVTLVEEAEAERGPVQSFADRFSGWYLPIVAAIAVTVFVVRRDPLATAAVLVVACSCAFAIATPVAMLSSIGSAARRGLLVKGGAYLEALARADVVLVDKTGTFTVGRPSVSEVISLNGVAPDEIVRLAASAERDSEHPLGAAIRGEGRRRGIASSAPESFEALEGLGVAALVEGRRVVVGSERIARREASTAFDPPAPDGRTLAWVVRDGEPIGALALHDEIRPEVPAAVEALRALGLEHVELLTGDHERAGAEVAKRLGVRYRAGLLPEDKIRVVREYQALGHTVVMIGDGVNDAPALAQADVGIAMGAAGTDLALEVAHVALLRDDWSLVPEAFRIARRTMGVVKGNFAFTGIYNVVGLTLAALGILPPILAAAAQSIPDLGILGNSARLMRPVRPRT